MAGRSPTKLQDVRGLGRRGRGHDRGGGSGRDRLRPRRRVTYTGSPLGAYACERVMPAAPLLKLPEGVAFETAAASTMRGLSAAYWLLKTNPWLKAGDTILLHAAASGT
jgi:NADPH2:quinone reductase